jgi:hypothetical protein
VTRIRLKTFGRARPRTSPDACDSVRFGTAGARHAVRRRLASDLRTAVEEVPRGPLCDPLRRLGGYSDQTADPARGRGLLLNTALIRAV